MTTLIIIVSIIYTLQLISFFWLWFRIRKTDKEFKERYKILKNN